MGDKEVKKALLCAKTHAKTVTKATASLSQYVAKSNVRLVTKLLSDLKKDLAQFDESVIEWCTVSGTDIDTDEYKWVDTVKDEADNVKREADEFLLECEMKDEEQALDKIQTAKVVELESICQSLLTALQKDVDEDLMAIKKENKRSFLDLLVADRTKEYEHCRQSLLTVKVEINKRDLSEKLTKLVDSVYTNFYNWKVKLNGLLIKHVPGNENVPRDKAEVKLEKLTCPVFFRSP